MAIEYGCVPTRPGVGSYFVHQGGSAGVSVVFLSVCYGKAVTGACVGHLETDGVEYYLDVTEKRNKKRRKILLDAARPVLAYVSRTGIGDDKEGPLFRPIRPDGAGLVRRHLDRKTPWRLVKKG